MTLPDSIKGSSSKRKMSPLAKATVVIVAAVAIAADILFPGWGRSVFSTAIVFAGMVVIWPQFWHRWWFWVSTVPPLIIQALVLYRVGAIRAFLEQVNPFAFFILLIVEAVALSVPLQIFVSHYRIPTSEIEGR